MYSPNKCSSISKAIKGTPGEESCYWPWNRNQINKQDLLVLFFYGSFHRWITTYIRRTKLNCRGTAYVMRTIPDCCHTIKQAPKTIIWCSNSLTLLLITNSSMRWHEKLKVQASYQCPVQKNRLTAKRLHCVTGRGDKFRTPTEPSLDSCSKFSNLIMHQPVEINFYTYK